MITRWQDQELSPKSYDDIASVASLGLKARTKYVDFEWTLPVTEAVRLRQAVHFWGCWLRGHFRTFESRMLGAINKALEEPWSVYKIWPTGKGDSSGLQVEGIRSGDQVTIRGQTPFAIMFTYGLYARKAQNPPNYWFHAIRSRLRVGLAEKIQRTVEQLGWDLTEMASPRLQPAVNKIFGLPADFQDTGTSIEMTNYKSTQHLRFYGPFHWRRSGALPCLFEESEGKMGGIYLWSVKVGDADRVHYIGQSRRSFRQRMTEHLNAYLSSEYKILDSAFLGQGELRANWEGSSAFRDAGARIEAWREKWQQTTPDLFRLLDEFRFFLAPMEGDRRIHERVEGALGAHYLCYEEDSIREFLEPGSRFRPRTVEEEPIRFILDAPSPIAGFPAELTV